MKKLILVSIAGGLLLLPISFTPNQTAGGCKLDFAILKKGDTSYISDLHFCDYSAYSFIKDIERQFHDTISETDVRNLKYEMLIVSNGVYVRGETEEPSRRQLDKTRMQMRSLLEKEHKTVLDVKSSR